MSGARKEVKLNQLEGVSQRVKYVFPADEAEPFPTVFPPSRVLEHRLILR